MITLEEFHLDFIQSILSDAESRGLMRSQAFFENVCEELADVINYCILMADALDVDLEEIVLSKLEKNKEKYPVDKAKGNSKKYTEL